MKKLLNVMRLNLKPLVGLAMVALIFSACKKSDNSGYTNEPVAGLMAFNLSPDKPAIGFALSGNTLGNGPLGYTSYTGLYLPVYTGNREVRSFDYSTGSIISISSTDFRDSSYYSAFLVGINGNYRNVVVNDGLVALNPIAGKAWVRYVNAIPDSTSTPVISISGDAETPVSDTVPFATVSDFRAVSAGPVKTSMSNGSNVDVNRDITLEENKIYTILFVGVPGQSDPVNKVQIKYIENGTATN